MSVSRGCRNHATDHQANHDHPFRGPVVRIGAVRVRLSPLPAAAAAASQSAADCCCPRSRIPLRTPPPPTSNNSRGIFSRGWPPAPVFRSSAEWRQRESSPSLTGCFTGVCKDGESEDRRWLVDEEDTLDRLSKFRFGGGDRDRARGAKRNPPHKKKPRSSDKTERLRELTEKLKTPPVSRPATSATEPGPSTASVSESARVCASATPSGPAPPPVVAPPETPPETQLEAPRERDVTPPLPQSFDDKFLECVNLKLPKPESRTIVGSYIQRTIPFRSASFSQVDFSPADGKYIRSGRSPAVSSKIPTLGTSSVCLTLPRKKGTENPGTSPASVSLASSVTTVVDVTDSSNPSIDSAVGSSEWIFPTAPTDAHLKPSTRSLTHPLTRSRSSTEECIPFRSIDGNGLKSLGVAERQLEGLREESDTDSVAPSESEVSATSGRPSESDNTNAQPVVKRCESDWESPESARNDSVSCCDYNTNIGTHSHQEVIIVCSDSNQNESNIDVENSNLYEHTNTQEYKINELVSENKLDSDENCSNNLASNQSSIKTYVTKWPDENTPSGEVKCIHTDYSHLKEVELPCQTSVEAQPNEKSESETTNTENRVSESFIECTTIATSVPVDNLSENAKQRWSDDCTSGDRTSSEWPSSAQEEPQSPDDGNTRPAWPRSPDRRWLERPRLVCQSSEERDDESMTRGSPKRFHPLGRTDSLSENESDAGDRRPTTPSRDRDGTASPSILGPSDQSDTESRFGSSVNVSRSPHTTRRYSKRPLRGPYGQMLEAEMKKPEANRTFSKFQYNEDLKFLENLSKPSGKPPGNRLRAVDDSHLKRSNTSPESPLSSVQRSTPKRKVSANIPFSAPNPPTSAAENPPVVHIRTTSSPSQLEGCATKASPRPSPQLLAQLLKGSSERVFVPETPPPLNHAPIPLHLWKDTRTHVVFELYETEGSYVDSLRILVTKYLQPLKSPENAGLVDAALVDEIFYQVPAILAHHEEFLEALRVRLVHWDVKQRVGDIFLDTFTKQSVIDTYTAFINNWKSAKEAIKTTCQAKPAFARFLEAMAREHKGKLALDSLLIMPVQRIPRYELLIQTLLKHTEPSHPDRGPLCEAQREVHALAVRINCTERESLELEQLEQLIEGAGSLHPERSDRSFLRHDLVSISSERGRKERALFLFSDLLIITSIKRRSGTIRKPSMNCPGTIASTLEANKYKMLSRIPLEDLEIVKEKDENLRRMLRDMEHLREDVTSLSQMCDLVSQLHCPHSQLEVDVRDMHSAISKQLAERQNSDSQLSCLELNMLNTPNGVNNPISVIFSKPDKRSSWEETFNEAKQRLAVTADKRLCPEFVASVPIRKTRAGLQFTCAAPLLGSRDVWVCNSDGYVGQVCVLSLSPTEPTVTSCNGVCNARILCIAAIPACPSQNNRKARQNTKDKSNISISVEDTEKDNINLERCYSPITTTAPDNDIAVSIKKWLTIRHSKEKAEILNSSSSSSEDEGVESTGLGGDEEGDSGGAGGDEGVEEYDHLQPTMWLGTEDGCIHVYNSSDNIRTKRNKIKIQHGSSVHSIIYLDNRVFVALANGDISVYSRDNSGKWNTSQPEMVTVGTVSGPVSRMAPVSNKLWCSCNNEIKVLNISNLTIEHQFSASGETHRSVSCLAVSGLGVWLSLQHSAVLRLFHASSYDCLGEVNIAPAVTKMLASCDDIIRQHKAACLRVTSLLACQDLLWVGTSAGVILTMPLPHVSPATTAAKLPQVSGVPHGHTGHVRFLTVVERGEREREGRPLVISGGDGYEDFRSASVSEVAGREDSTNHLLLWQA